QRMHNWRKSCSGTLPGGLIGRSAVGSWSLAPEPLIASAEPTPPRTAEQRPIPAARKPRRPNAVSWVGGSLRILSSNRFQRSTNLIASVGQTPPQVWQSVQSVVRVVKSGLMASKGQISTHLLQWMQDDSTLRSLMRNRLPSENRAPLGHTYLHQKRGFQSPMASTATKRMIEMA